MLRRLRIVFAAVFFCAVTWLFVDFSGTAQNEIGFFAKMQFLPALLAANFLVVAILLLLTLLFGRIYCSVICPLGVFQDIVSHIAASRKRNKFAYAKPKTALRIAFLAAFVAIFALGFVSVAAIIAPYSAYGRIASNLFAPIWALGENVLSFFSEKAGGYTFYPVELWFKGIAIFAVAVATFAVVAIFAWRTGRGYCNTVCPVGTFLGFFSKFAFFRPIINLSKCNSCGLCARNCKAKCINPKAHEIDYSRCVDCFNCIKNCRNSAISYKFALGKKNEGVLKTSANKLSPKKVDLGKSSSRRGFFATLFTVAASATANAAEKTVDGGFAPIKPRKNPEREIPLVPAGAQSAAHLSEKCTACQLCVSACPSHVLEPSAKLGNFMQPNMSYLRGYCATDCIECSKVCPTGAILPVSVAEKSSIQIGMAKVHLARCIVNTDEMQCDNCFRQCPTSAITMVPKDAKNPKSRKVPVVDEARCIGCGACENLCPARPLSAICVEAISVHNIL